MAEPDITRPGEPAARRPRFYRTLVEQQPDLISALDPNMVAALTWVEDELEAGGGARARA